jgi:hypothetical protein
MAHGHEVAPDDEYYVDPVEGMKDLLAFVAENPCIRMDGIFRDPDLKPWVWSGAPWDRDEKFYQNDKKLAKLCAENEATKMYALYGYRIALPDSVVLEYLQSHGFPFEEAIARVGMKRRPDGLYYP